MNTRWLLLLLVIVSSQSVDGKSKKKMLKELQRDMAILMKAVAALHQDVKTLQQAQDVTALHQDVRTVAFNQQNMLQQLQTVVKCSCGT